MNYNPLLAEVRANPYPYYAYLREHAPVYWVESIRSWAVSRYADVDYVLRNPQVFSSAGLIGNFLGDLNPVPEVPWLVELSETTIPAGALVFYLNGSANRDERKYSDPERFDVMRNPQDHLAFGYGIHYCLGAQLARLEAKVALEALLFEHPPFVRTPEEVTRGDGLAVRGPKTLPLRFETTRRAVA